MKKKKTNEPLWIEMYRKKVLKPKERERLSEQKGRTEASQSGFYQTRGWKMLREQRRSANPLCQHCEARGLIRSMTTVDHIISVEERPDLALSFDNTQSLCDFCHNVKTKADEKQKQQRQKLNSGKIMMQKFETGGGVG